MSRFRYDFDRQAAIRAEVARLTRLDVREKSRRFHELTVTDPEMAQAVADRYDTWRQR